MSKKSKNRDCPVVGRPIKSIECGENRHRSYKCPADCPHSPFSLGNYEQFSDIEDRTDTATITRAFEDPHSKAVIEKAARERSKGSPHTWFSTLVDLFFNRKDEDGLLFGERWEQAGYPGLKGDEKLLFNCKRQARFSLLEVQTVDDSKTLTCVDLLLPTTQPFTLVDKSLTATASRFQRFACIAYPSPNFWRVNGPIITLPKTRDFAPVETLAEIVKHLGGALEQSWLMENLARVADAADATQKELQRLALLNSDLVDASAYYHISKPLSKLRPKLKKAGFQLDELTKTETAEGWKEAYLLMLTKQESQELEATLPGATPYLGALLLQNGKAKLTTTSQANLEALKSRFESACGPDASFSKELITNQAAQQAHALDATNSQLVPSSLVKDISSFLHTSSRTETEAEEDSLDRTAESLIHGYYKKLIDEPIPQLENKTPNEAAVDFLLRPKLIEWAKGVATNVDSQNLHSGVQVDINWLFKELGLHEIDFPAPPPRARPFTPDDSSAEDDLLENAEDLELDELDQLIQRRLESYETAADALDDMEASGCHLIDELYAATEGIIDADQYDIVIPLLICAWLAVVPAGKHVPIPQDLAARCVGEFLDATAEQANTPGKSEEEAIVEISRDPLLIFLLAEKLDTTNKSLPKKQRLDNAGKASAFATLLIGINVLLEAYERAEPR